MNVIKSISPGQPGSHRFVTQWGEQLLKVRYRRDDERALILTTIELVVDARKAHDTALNQQQVLALRKREVVAVRIDYSETTLRQQVKARGAQWSRSLKLWLMHRGTASELALNKRIVEGAADQCTDIDTSFLQ